MTSHRNENANTHPRNTQKPKPTKLRQPTSRSPNLSPEVTVTITMAIFPRASPKRVAHSPTPNTLTGLGPLLGTDPDVPCPIESIPPVPPANHPPQASVMADRRRRAVRLNYSTGRALSNPP
ncbi:hypothetical protein K456DRAFT_52457 [Colletotrichum gloeosporioides 23]|nr:hypothetical protein K456DRAFT_52457 [Colletotrichum gloeosporioides 23]